MSNNPCHIHSSFEISNVDDIRNEVCKNLSTEKHADENYYCLLHSPKESKSKIEFRKIINERIRFIEAEIKTLESSLVSKDEKTKAISELTYDFRYVFFPSEIHFNKQIFKTLADFGWTTFKYVLFNFATFEQGANFTSAKFTQDVLFNSSVFIKEIRFDSAIFLKEAIFSRAKIADDIYFNESLFKGKANFRFVRFNYDSKKLKETNQQELPQASFFQAKFCKEVDFQYVHFCSKSYFFKAEFLKEASFRYAKFFKDSNFKWAKFAGDTFFDKCRFREFTDFGSSIFATNSDIFFRKTIFYKNVNFGYVTFASFITFESHRRIPIFNYESFINFQNIRNESSARVAFNQIMLRPCWFINVDSTSYIFNAVNWNNVYIYQAKKNVEIELANIDKLEKEKEKKHIIENPKSIFKITCRQLAINAENNNRFEEASKFRQMAFEVERLERKEKQNKWWREEFLCSSIFGVCLSKLKTAPYDFIHFLYRVSSFYGESSTRAFLVLASIIFFSAFLYWSPLSQFVIPNKETYRSLDFLESIFYSLRVMVLQRPDPSPSNTFGKAILTLESVLAPLQIALLALAIRRKFMR